MAENYLDRMLREIGDDYGENVILNPQDIIDRPRQVIPVSPAIDIGLSGGIPEGSTVVFSGPAKAGKTTTALQFVANAQKEEYGGRHCYYLDVEGRLKNINLTGIQGLNLDKFTPIRSSEDKLLTGEDYLEIAEKAIKTHPGCVVIIDSLSAIIPELELTCKLNAQLRASTPKLLAHFFKRVGGSIPITNTILINMQHFIANTSGYGLQKEEDGGNYVKYQSDVKLRIKQVKYWTNSDSETPIGQVVNWEVIYSALGAPGQKVDSYIRYGIGIDTCMELAQMGVLSQLIRKKGAWYTCDFMKSHLDVMGVEEWDEKLVRVQGENNLCDFLREHPPYLELLEQKCKELLI
jgi:recombination protein RecA